VAGRAIFRESAIEAYRRGAKRDSVPRLTSWPVIVCVWMSLGVLIAGTVLAWSVRIPSYLGASGVILEGTAAALFLTPEQSARLRVGQPVHAHIGSSGVYMQGAIADIEPGSVIVRLEKTPPPEAYRGSHFTARVEVGTQRIFGFLR
jgi:hypothetical protein